MASASQSPPRKKKEDDDDEDGKSSLKKRIQELEKELQKTREELSEVREEQQEERDLAESLVQEFTPPPNKLGYLFQWQDRAIGWSGSKWSLLFVRLDRGRIACYENHMDQAPLSVLTLRGCAVQDEGYKRNRRHKKNEDNLPLEENGAYFHVFEIYHQPEGSVLEEEEEDDDHTTSNGKAKSNKYKNSATLPLLRFSTTSLAEKTQWMELISETCAYCETETFMNDEANRVAQEQKQLEQQTKLASSMPEATTRGTLPALYFAPAVSPLKQMQRRKSVAKRRKSSAYLSQAKTGSNAELKEALYPPSKPMHVKAAPSYLSSEAPKQNYRGLFNLSMILLIISNFRLIIETIKKHGLVLMSVSEYFQNMSHTYTQDPWRNFPFVTGFLLLQGYLIMAFVVEWMLSRGSISERLGMTFHNVIAHAALLKSISIVWYSIDNPFVGATLLFNGVIVWMKLISYSCANEDYRLSVKSGDHSMMASLALLNNLEPADEDIVYPRNITLGNLYYFWLAPTLTYQITFPRTPRVRMGRVIGIFLGLIACATLATFLVAQFVTPTLSQLVLDLEQTGGVYTPKILAIYWLKLAITNTYLWLLMFYSYFHLYLNFWAELLRFGDRVFYKDWWNSSEISSYWRLWNMPVHMWLVRHVYFPCIRMHMSKTVAMLVVFTLSAILHEVLVSVPFHLIRPWSFLGMMGQIPLVAITKAMYRRNPGSSLGNVTFWLSFCIVGQPMAILMYTADYQFAKRHAELQMASALK